MICAIVAVASVLIGVAIGFALAIRVVDRHRR